MKTSAFSRLILLPLASLALLATAPLALDAQEAPKPAPSPAEEKRIDFQIHDTRLDQILSVLHENFPDYHFTCEREIAHLKISDIQLHSATAYDAAMAIFQANNLVQVNQPRRENPHDRDFRFFSHLADPDLKSVKTGVEAFSLKDEVKDEDMEGPVDRGVIPKRREIRMIQIRRMVSSTIRDILSQGVLPVGEEPAFQFYPEANVLIAIGSRDGIEITRKIVNAMNGANSDAASERRELARPAKSETAPAPGASPSPTPTR